MGKERHSSALFPTILFDNSHNQSDHSTNLGYDEFDSYYQRFFKRHDKLSDEEKERINIVSTLANSTKSHRILEIGSGAGDVSKTLHKPKEFIVTSDISIISDFQDWRQKTNLGDFVRCSATNLPFNEKSFDAIIFSEVLEHLDTHSQRDSIEEIKRCLEVGGFLILSTPNPNSFTRKFSRVIEKVIGVKKRAGDQLIENWRSTGEIQSMLSPDFSISRIIGSYYSIPLLDRSKIKKISMAVSLSMRKIGVFPKYGLYQIWLAKRK